MNAGRWFSRMIFLLTASFGAMNAQAQDAVASQHLKISNIGNIILEPGNTVSLDFAKNTTHITVTQLRNDSSTNTSGTLRLEVWMSKNADFPGLPAVLVGWQVATYTFTGNNNGRLGPKQAFQNVDVTVPLSNLPAEGGYKVYLYVSEYSAPYCPDSANFCAVSNTTLTNFAYIGTRPTIIEFYNSNLDNFFITADPIEAAAIDNGGAGPGWARTGNTFKWGGSSYICRFYGSFKPGPNSHFYTVDPAECQALKSAQFPPNDPRRLTTKSWNFESLDFVSTPALTGGVNGTCVAGTVPVYRAYNNGFSRGVDSNHRITTNLSAIQQVVARGWANEGVVMCAPS